MISWFLPQVSTYAWQIDYLIAFILALTGFWTLAVSYVFFKLLWDGRASKNPKAEYLVGNEKHVKNWITYPHYVIIFLDIFVIIGAVYVWYSVKQHLPEKEAEVRVIARQWAWTFEHEGPDGQLGTSDDIRTVDELHIEVDKLYHYKLESVDVLHDFSVPVFRLKHDAIPGRQIVGWFEAQQTGEYDIQCAEICGIGHGLMVAKLYIHTPEEYAAWQAKMSAAVRK